MREVNVTTEILIDRPINEVASFASNPDNATRWYRNIKSVEWKTPKPLRIGSKLAFVANFLGRRLEYVYEVTEMKADETFVMRTSDGPFPMQTTYRWEKIADSKTKMFLQNRGMPSGFSGLMAPFMSLAMKSANRKDLAALKNILESSARA